MLRAGAKVQAPLPWSRLTIPVARAGRLADGRALVGDDEVHYDAAVDVAHADANGSRAGSKDLGSAESAVAVAQQHADAVLCELAVGGHEVLDAVAVEIAHRQG